MRKWEYLVLVENVRSLKSLEDLAKDDELYADPVSYTHLTLPTILLV